MSVSGVKDKSDTPVMRQYKSIKERYPDTILLFRMGDFYEMFYEDAITASKILGIVLTSRQKNQENPVPMAGVPYHSVTGYLKKLLDSGFRVAVCEQLEEPSKGKAIVARDVVRIITPGVNVEAELLESNQSNYLCALSIGKHDVAKGNEGDMFGLALADISTGEMLTTYLEDISSLTAELVKFDPKEVLIPRGYPQFEEFIKGKLPDKAVTSTGLFEEYGDFQSALKKIGEITGKDEGNGDIYAGRLNPLCATACAVVLDYLSTTQPGQPIPIPRIAVYRASEFMILDETTMKHLELTSSTWGEKKGSLLWLIDKTITPMGGRLLRSWLIKPLMDISSIRRRQDAIEYFVQNGKTREKIRYLLREICDIERIISRCVLKTATPRELKGLSETLTILPSILEVFDEVGQTEILKGTNDLFGSLPEVPSLLTSKLSNAIVDNPPNNTREGGIFKKGYNEELDELDYLSTSSKEAVASLEAKEREATGIQSLKIRYNKVFGYYIEVTKSNLSLVPHDRYIRKQTIAGGERFVTEELKQLEEKILSADEKRKNLEAELFSQLVGEVARNESSLRKVSAFLSTLDVICALAEVAVLSGWSRPVVNDSGIISIKDGRHPVVEAIASPDGFVPNDVCLDLDGERVWIITGPNMSGKSTFMRQVALCTILAQMGSFIPASQAVIGICDRIFTRVGASDNLSWGQSTFMVEMLETASILEHATRKSLVVLDEIGRGTSTFDGMSIAWATAEYLLTRVGCRTLMATHYHELVELSSMYPNVANYNVSATEFGDKIIFLRKVKKGGSSRSYGIQVARLAGMPSEVIERAKAILSQIESGRDKTVSIERVSKTKAKAGRDGETGIGSGDGNQLNIFIQSRGIGGEDKIRKLLQEIDIEKMTPLEAMNFIAHLKTLL